MNHEKTFAAIKKLQEVEIEMHRLKNALELANKALETKRTWVELTEDEAFACKGRDYFETYKAIEAKLKEKNT